MSASEMPRCALAPGDNEERLAIGIRPMSRKSPLDLAMCYPNVNAWVFGGGWIEIGQGDHGGPFARALDEGGQVWEGKRMYNSLEDVLKDLERGIAKWLRKHG